MIFSDAFITFYIKFIISNMVKERNLLLPFLNSKISFTLNYSV